MKTEQRIRAIRLIGLIEENPSIGQALGVEIRQRIERETARKTADKSPIEEQKLSRDGETAMEGVRL